MSDQSAAEFRAAAQALNEAADKDLRREVYAAFRTAAKPLGVRVIRDGAAQLPRRGGLSARVAGAKMAQSNSTAGRNPGVSLRFQTAPSMDLKSIAAGILRHPVFGQWVSGMKPQSIRAKAFTTPFEAGREPVAKQVVAAMQKVSQQIAHNSRSRA